MSLTGLSNLSISKEKYSFSSQIKKKISQQKFREFINNNKNTFSWYEETNGGKIALNNIEGFVNKESILKTLNQSRAYAFYKKEKDYYSLDIFWHDEYGHLVVNINNSRVTIEALELLFSMAEFCDAMLLVSGKKQITKEFIEKEKLVIAAKKAVKKTSKGKE